MSFFWSTQELASETPLPASTDRKSAIALLHEHATVQNLQPLVTDSKPIPVPSPNEPVVTEATSACPEGSTVDYRAVTIAVPFGPFGSTSITSKSAYMDADDGVIATFQAPMGVSGRLRYRVVATDDGKGLILREEAKITGVSVMMPFILGTEKENHAKHRMSIAKELERRAGVGGKVSGT
ncbi:uncharacterized protein LY89DRAFT_790220 [Mollisia scopiformis]|uniref:DUF7053 domain-containing protein n=1 Tax=Mollisia scopiformis TaxID=149040 RepID=A0A132B357_MOLSC|nr:uncharacterized protein LY89DRAFT_790220 [Mollisia scopiformis]KUJ06838.1 hypothetical protein LY89DRAFT_790220 [Mollisia scopiformis]